MTGGCADFYRRQLKERILNLNYISLLNTIATLFLLLASGFISRKIGFIDETSTKKLSDLIVKIGQPFLIISSLISLEYSPENLRKGLSVLALSIFLHIIMAALAFIFSRGFRSLDERKISEFAMVFTNCGFIGFPIIDSLYGSEGLFCGAFYLIGFHIFTWTWGIFILSKGRSDIKLTSRKVFVNFGTVPSLIGFVLFLLPFRMPDFLVGFSSYLSGLCTPVAMLITGALLATRDLRRIFTSAGNYLVCFCKLVVIPATVAVILRLCGLGSFYVIFGTVMAAMPSAAVVTMFCEMYDLDSGYASELVGISSLFSVATLPVIVALAQFVAEI